MFHYRLFCFVSFLFVAGEESSGIVEEMPEGEGGAGGDLLRWRHSTSGAILNDSPPPSRWSSDRPNQ